MADEAVCAAAGEDVVDMELPFNLADPKALLLLLLLPPVIYLGVLGARARPRDRGRIGASVVIRCLILLLLTLAIAGFQWISNGGPLSVVFLVDESGSVPTALRQTAHDYIQRALAQLGPDEQAGVVRFGESAIVDRAISGSASWEPAPGVPGVLATNIGDAIQTGLALFPEGGSRRLVLLSDGLQTVGDARTIVADAHSTGVELSVVPLGSTADNEVAIEGVSSPQAVPEGQKYEARVLLNSTSDRSATVTLFDGDKQVGQQEVIVKSGKTVVQFNLQADAEGFRTIRAEVSSTDDKISENNKGESFTVVSAPPSILIIAGATEDGEPLKRALEASNMKATIVPVLGMPVGMDTLAEYDTVVLANVSTDALGIERQQLLQSFVRDLGHGLIMLGGEHSFGAGGYLRSPLEQVLPVTMDVRTSEQRASIAMTFLVDKSGSMGRCHCGGAAQFDPTMRTEFGPSKVELSKQAIARAANLLNSTDQIGVVGFDSEAHPLINIQPMGDLGSDGILLDLAPVEAAGGPTNLYAGMQAAIDQIQGTTAGLKHIILISDGWTQQADFAALLAEMQDDTITLSTVGAGEGPGEVLKDLAEKGGGRYYSAANIMTLPDILLKETVRLAGQYYIEKPVAPRLAKDSPILSELDVGHLPELLGYNATTLKPTADGILLSPEGDPILAQWQYGLGRSVAWTPDMKGRWATNWVTWPQFSQFAGQMVQWTVSASDSSGIEADYQLTPSGTHGEQNLNVTVQSLDAQGKPRNGLHTTVTLTDTAGVQSTVQLAQESPGVYVGTTSGLNQGVYQTEIQQRSAGYDDLVAREVSGVVVPYSSEFAVIDNREQTASEFMTDMAQLGGGQVLNTGNTTAVWSHDLPAQPLRVPLWPWLLLAAILLFPLDVAVRRLSVSWKDLRLIPRSPRERPSTQPPGG
jgi:Ca-activated chloride channel family protein